MISFLKFPAVNKPCICIKSRVSGGSNDLVVMYRGEQRVNRTEML